MLLPSCLNWTPATPTLSEAEAETVTLAPETSWPFGGAVTETVGGVVSAGGGGGGGGGGAGGGGLGVPVN